MYQSELNPKAYDVTKAGAFGPWLFRVRRREGITKNVLALVLWWMHVGNEE